MTYEAIRVILINIAGILYSTDSMLKIDLCCNFDLVDLELQSKNGPTWPSNGLDHGIMESNSAHSG